MIRNFISSRVVKNKVALELVTESICKLHGIKLCKLENSWILGGRTSGIKISTNHLHYVPEIIENFDFFFDSVSESAHLEQNLTVVDFSQAKFHKVRGFPHFEIHFPSISEPIETSNQYIDHLGLSSGQTILDLGAYAGVSSIKFMEVVGVNGRVIAVEPDPISSSSARVNFKNFQKKFGFTPELVEKAAWSHSGKVKFAMEGNLGSAVSLITGRTRHSADIESITLSDLATEKKLKEIHAIKADIEGSESEVFLDSKFFTEFKPNIIFEAVLRGQRKYRFLSAIKALKSYGYTCDVISQSGSSQSLIIAKHRGLAR